MNISVDRIKRVSYREFKEIYQNLFFQYEEQKNLVFILGCQRSGTTILSEVIERDFRTKVYKESQSKVSTKDQNGLRLDPLPILKKEIYSNNTKTIVLKPLVESQYTNRLLNEFPEGKVIWVLRHYKGVISSDLKKFGPKNGTENLRKILEEDTWRSEQMSENTLVLIKKYFKPDMSQYDAAALFWYSRNILFFEQELGKNDNVLICRYEELVSRPRAAMKALYQFIDFAYPKKEITSKVHNSSIKKGKDLKIDPEIESICEELYNKFNAYD